MVAESAGAPVFSPTHIGIDLGTTFCCQAYVDTDGRPRVIPSAEGEPTTPSVVWFYDNKAYVGRRANEFKTTSGSHVYELMKRDLGKPLKEVPHLVGGYRYGAVGLSALLLRKLKRDALREFKRRGFVDNDTKENGFSPKVIITVPAHFGQRQRKETWCAGEAAGLTVLGMINEPSAAALCYATLTNESRRILVFDLGGGTFDITILSLDRIPTILTSSGNAKLGGKDWDAIIERYLYDCYRRRFGKELGTDDATMYDVQQKALAAKLELSKDGETIVTVVGSDGEVDVSVKRARSAGGRRTYNMDSSSEDFYLEDRARDLLNQCQRLCESTLSSLPIDTPGGGSRPMNWSDIDEVVLVGGSCRMPMVPALVEQITGKPVRRLIDGFDYDTAVAVGAALYGLQLVGTVAVEFFDVLSHSIGILLERDGRSVVKPVFPKNSRLPVEWRQRYAAPANSYVELVEGDDSTVPDEATSLLRLELQNPEGDVDVLLRLSADGVLLARARQCATGEEKFLELHHALHAADEVGCDELGHRVQAVQIVN